MFPKYGFFAAIWLSLIAGCTSAIQVEARSEAPLPVDQNELVAVTPPVDTSAEETTAAITEPSWLRVTPISPEVGKISHGETVVTRYELIWGDAGPVPLASVTIYQSSAIGNGSCAKHGIAIADAVFDLDTPKKLGSFTWNASALEPGEYALCAEFLAKDFEEVSIWSPKTITVVSLPCPLPTGQPAEIKAVARWQTADRTYSVDEVGTYQWRVPTGWHVLSGEGSSAINVDVADDGPDGQVEVAFKNECGSGPWRSLAVERVKPGIISTADGLAAIAADATSLSGVYDLAIDIDLNGANWEPIGTGTQPFKGVFRGHGFTISNLKIDRPTTNNLGLFGYVDDENDNTKGIISNLILSQVRVNQEATPGNITSAAVGGLVGTLFGTVQSVEVEGLLACAANCGVLVGYSTGMILQSGASGAVTAYTSTAGGLVGDHRGIVRESRASAAVSAPTRSGGLVGLHYPYAARHSVAEITDSYATGAVSQIGTPSSVEIGGLAARVDQATIRRSYATGNVSAELLANDGAGGAGGLVGNMLHGLIEQSFATGNIAGHTNVGGLIGLLTNYSEGTSVVDSFGTTINNALITECHATGATAGYNSVGGFVGRNRGYINRSYATGSVEATVNLGGFVGLNYGENGTRWATTIDTYATGFVAQRGATAASNLGGFAGRSDTAQMVRSYASGAVGAGTSVGGFVGSVCCSNVFTSALWNTDTTGLATSFGGAGKTTAELQNASTFATWDLTSIWLAPDGAPPKLRWALWNTSTIWHTKDNVPPTLQWE